MGEILQFPVERSFCRLRRELASTRDGIAGLQGSLTDVGNALAPALLTLHEVSQICRQQLDTLGQTLDFCAECHAAWDIEDLASLERVRDQLSARAGRLGLLGASPAPCP